MPPRPSPRTRELMDTYPAVAEHAIPPHVLILCRDGDGNVVHAELLDAAGEPLPYWRAIERLGPFRRYAQAELERATDAIVALVAAAPLRDRNIAGVHAATGIARQTLYNRAEALTQEAPAA